MVKMWKNKGKKGPSVEALQLPPVSVVCETFRRVPEPFFRRGDQTPPMNNRASKATVQDQMQDLKRKYAELEVREKRMMEGLEGMMKEEEAAEKSDKAGASVKNTSVIGLEIDTSGLVRHLFFWKYVPTPPLGNRQR